MACDISALGFRDHLLRASRALVGAVFTINVLICKQVRYNCKPISSALLSETFRGHDATCPDAHQLGGLISRHSLTHGVTAALLHTDDAGVSFRALKQGSVASSCLTKRRVADDVPFLWLWALRKLERCRR